MAIHSHSSSPLRLRRGRRFDALASTPVPRPVTSSAGRVFSRRELLELVRDYEALDQDEKTINVHISHLREKVEDDPANPRRIVTVWGVGYRYEMHTGA